MQERGDIVTGVEGETTGLSGYYLQAEVAKCGLARLADAFEEALIVEIAAYALAGAQRIDAVESHAALSKLSGEADDVGKDLLLLLKVKIDVGT